MIKNSGQKYGVYFGMERSKFLIIGQFAASLYSTRIFDQYCEK